MPTKKTEATTAVKTKKAPAKAVAKTVAKKPVAKVSKSKPEIVCAPGEQCFWTTDGRVLANLVELRDALAEMDEEVFTQHVTEERNEFADWVEQVLGDAELAKAMRKAKKAGKAYDLVVTRLRIYSV